MPTVTISDFQTAVQKFSPEPILTAVDDILDRLCPLLSSDSSLNAKITSMLHIIVERFVQGVKFIFMTSGHMSSGLTKVTSMLASLHRYTPSDIIHRLESIVEEFMCAHANAADGQEVYKALKTDIEQQIKQAVDSYGADTMVQVTTKRGVEQISIQNLGTSVIKHTGEMDACCSQMVDLLWCTNEILREFLGNEHFSLEQPLTEAALWSTHLFRTWNLLAGYFNRIQTQLRPRIRKYPSWFQNIVEEEDSLLEADAATRKPQLLLPVIKLKVPDNPKPTATAANVVTVADASQATMPRGSVRSGECIVRLESIDRTKPGVSSIKLVVSALQSGVWFRRIKTFYVMCRVTPVDKSSPIRFVNNKPATAKDVLDDPTLQPKECKPSLKLDTSAHSATKWIFSRPLYRWNPASVIPSEFTISFDLEHTVQVRVDFYAVFTYHQRLYIPLLTVSEQLFGKQDIAPGSSPADASESHPALTASVEVDDKDAKGPTIVEIPSTSTKHLARFIR